MRTTIALLLAALAGCAPSTEPCTGVGAHPLLYLSDAGCATCNRHFAALCATYATRPGADIVLRANGAQVDISAFLLADTTRVRWDDDGTLARCLGLRGSAAVFFAADGRPDTVVRLDARTLERDLDYIRTRLP